MNQKTLTNLFGIGIAAMVPLAVAMAVFGQPWSALVIFIMFLVLTFKLKQVKKAVTARLVNMVLAETLKIVGQRFREYEKHHAAKPDPSKAKANADMAALCEAAIQIHKEAPR